MDRIVAIVLGLLIIIIGFVVVQNILEGQAEIPRVGDGVQCIAEGGQCLKTCDGETLAAQCGEGLRCCGG